MMEDIQLPTKGLDKGSAKRRIHSQHLSKTNRSGIQDRQCRKIHGYGSVDRVSIIGSTLSSNLDKMTDEEQNKYKQFLQNELRKLDEQDNETTDGRNV